MYWLGGLCGGGPRDWSEASQELAISQSYSACPINFNIVLVMIFCLHNLSCPLPASWIVSNLILYENFGSHRQWWELLGVFCPGFVMSYMSLCHCFFPVFQQLLPSIVWVVFPWQNWQTIPNLSSEHCHGWGELGDRVHGVAVGEDPLVEGIYI